MSAQRLRDFLLQEEPTVDLPWTAVSLFSGAGLSDLGYQMAGFRFMVQVEIDQRRAAIGADNFPTSQWLTRDIRGSEKQVATAYRRSTSRRLDLLVATPPCQGMSSSNPSRGKRQTPQAKALETKNRLLLEAIPVALLLKPRIIVIENVRQVLTLEVENDGKQGTAVDVLRNRLPDYDVFTCVVNAADYGIPQIRRRAVVVGIHKDEPWLELMCMNDNVPVPSRTHSEKPKDGLRAWVSIKEWFESMDYQELDSSSIEGSIGIDPLHFVPSYGEERYRQISEIPAYSGRSAYENDACPSCAQSGMSAGLIHCPSCGEILFNRPYVERDGVPSLIKGFKSSYRRMTPHRPSYTITTNSSHVGSDYKIHPWENRVLSILECADLQTIPRFYDWSRPRKDKTTYLIRNLVGEALPPYFTYLHGQHLSQLLARSLGKSDASAAANLQAAQELSLAGDSGGNGQFGVSWSARTCSLQPNLKPS